MAALAADTDIEARLGRALTSAEDARVGALLDDASARVRRYTGQTFTVVNDDTVILRPVGSYLLLPQLPVISVSSVVGVDDNGVPGGEISGWVFDGVDRIDMSCVGFGFVGDIWWPWSYGPESFQVVYSHGEADAPDDVVGVVCAMVIRVLLSPSMVEGLNTERIGQYSYGFQQGGGGTPGAVVRLSEQDKEILSSYRRQAGSVQVRL